MIDIKKIKAHCDIPCAIYDTMPAQYQALSVIRFLDLINEISNSLDDPENLAKLVRLIDQKEVHAVNAKNEITTIWGDYFKEPQISKYPEIHEITHSIMIAASKCKQSLDRQNGLDLLKNINQFSEIFWATKDMETELKTVPYEPKLEVVCPK